MLKVPKQAEAKGDVVINQHIYNFNKFLYVKFRCSANATNQPKSTVETFPLTKKLCNQEGTYLQKNVNTHPYGDRGPTASPAGEVIKRNTNIFSYKA